MSIAHAGEAASASTSSRTGRRATEKSGVDPRELIAAARLAGRASLNEADGKRLLADFGVAVPRFSVVSSAQNMVDMSAPFAVKVLSQDIVHKSDVGAVVLNVESVEAVAEAIEKIARQPAVQGARVDGYLV